ncbi:diol dehydratase reactivase subunit alpha [Mycobacterium botniense]|uniref:Diol dehydratase reactivase subunit alpha n=1 Tax=Mycobacterium botniense TaxID=84962 RepID=A0A7I9XTK4_9MYCO|nr:diol dehydratase reactivase subunit alpha [Mycobacterium botniense]GFG73339.1 diol dehydratase reactivase subunit alpha [Mycobacterium botniense]
MQAGRAGGCVVGVDIGNSTTEACVARVGRDGGVEFLGSALTPTTGVKGTTANSAGVVAAVRAALGAARTALAEVTAVLVNEATPVISGLAMETITETIITESTMIGHDPRTPAGVGLGVGVTTLIDALDGVHEGAPIVVVVPSGWDFEDAATAIRECQKRGVDVRAAIVSNDDAVLIVNRLAHPIPVVDEVSRIDAVPLGMVAAVEVAESGRTIRTLSNVYGLATVFGLDAEQTRMVSPVARALSGSRSAVVVRTPGGEVRARSIPAGSLELFGASRRARVAVSQGAEAIMAEVGRVQPLDDVVGEPGTCVGGMISTVRERMAELSGQSPDNIRIRDLLAVDTVIPQQVRGGLAGEVALENAVGLAAMVRTNESGMRLVADAVERDLVALGAASVRTIIGGVEAEVAIRGALTTPGTDIPLAVLDLGGGSTDAAFVGSDGSIRTVHMAGAGDLVTKLIDTELGLDSLEVAEEIKRCPLAKVESFYHVRLEDGTTQFFKDSLPTDTFARVVTLGETGPSPIPGAHSLEQVREVRRSAKRRVFEVNALRALAAIAPGGDLRRIDFVVLLGGSALDFEIPAMITDALAPYGIVCGTGNVRGTEGPRNAVATGLVAGYAEPDAGPRSGVAGRVSARG